VVRGLLETSPGLEAKAVFEHLQRVYPERFQDGQLRTLQRKVFFSQQHHAGRLCASDFTHMEELGVTIQGQSFPHLIYHFVLTYSNWETAKVCFSESFESLSEGLQNALWELGKVPERHRTDRLSTAVNNTIRPAEFTERYAGLMRCYGLKAERIQAGHGNKWRYGTAASSLQAGAEARVAVAWQSRLRQSGCVSELPAGSVRV
jgi:hypothetical protein